MSKNNIGKSGPGSLGRGGFGNSHAPGQEESSENSRFLCCHCMQYTFSHTRTRLSARNDIVTVLASTTVDLYFLHNFQLDSSEVV